jgi:hypothetical protein
MSQMSTLQRAVANLSLICLANTTGVDLEAALDGALDKYRGRLTFGDDAGSGR